MNWWNRLFWKVSLRTNDYNTFSKNENSIIAFLTFESSWHEKRHTFSLTEAEYMEYLNDVNTGNSKWFKRIL